MCPHLQNRSIMLSMSRQSTTFGMLTWPIPNKICLGIRALGAWVIRACEWEKLGLVWGFFIANLLWSGTSISFNFFFLKFQFLLINLFKGSYNIMKILYPFSQLYKNANFLAQFCNYFYLCIYLTLQHNNCLFFKVDLKKKNTLPNGSH